MSGLVKAIGNMYAWVTHCHTHLRGACAHRCAYCYAARAMRGHPSPHLGKLRLDPAELDVSYGGATKTIFIEHKHDLFAENVPQTWIELILDHCARWPKNDYVLQTKNPARMLSNLWRLPRKAIIGTTLETNRTMSALISCAPPPRERAKAFERIETDDLRFVTIEPVMQFDYEVLAQMVANCRPWAINIGADSKGHHLPEPSAIEIRLLVAELRRLGMHLINLKRNLGRILGPVWCRRCAVTPAECTLWDGGGELCAECAREIDRGVA
jgi:protein gp37